MTRKHIASIAATVLAALAACYGLGWLTGEQATVLSGFVVAVGAAWGVNVKPVKTKLPK